MATSRTGTSAWKRTVRIVRHRDRHLTNCPMCNVTRNWGQGLQPNSAEVDHVIPHSLGGTDSPENAQILCRRCNQSMGAKRGVKRPLKSVKAEDIDAW